MKLELDDLDVKTIIEVLKYSLESCPIESISDQVSISSDGIEELIEKLEWTLEQG